MSDELSATEPPTEIPVEEPPVGTPSPPDIVRLDDILSDIDFLRRKEAEDKVLIESIATLSTSHIREKAKAWALSGFPPSFPLYQITLSIPRKCSDGISRNLAEYIEFLTSEDLYQHLDKLKEKVSGFTINFAVMGTTIVFGLSN